MVEVAETFSCCHESSADNRRGTTGLEITSDGSVRDEKRGNGVVELNWKLRLCLVCWRLGVSHALLDRRAKLLVMGH